jgi:hypothetical protein
MADRAWDRARAVAHFGSEEITNDHIARFPATVRATTTQIRVAYDLGKHDDLVCLLYQLRGAASWVFADALSHAALALLDAVTASDSDPERCARALQHLTEEVERTCDAVERGCELVWIGDSSSAPAPSAPSASAPSTSAPSSSAPSFRASTPRSPLEDVLQTLDRWENESSLFHSMAKRFPLHFDRTLQRMRECLDERDWLSLVRRAYTHAVARTRDWGGVVLMLGRASPCVACTAIPSDAAPR